ncbi:MAG: ATP-binding protein, partial [Actinobacteria bacterium]|nr:ATP-binding protein [Actinomycetota bacterium]
MSSEQSARSLDGGAGEPLPGGVGESVRPDWGQIAADGPGWGWLREGYGLSDFELDLVLIALAPEVDLRYERVYGYLQDDVSRKRPTVDLALNLLSTTPGEKLAGRALLGWDAPLVSRKVFALIPDPHSVSSPLLAHILKLDEQIVDILLGQGGLDPRLASCCRLMAPQNGFADTLLAEDVRKSLLGMVDVAWGRHPLRLYFQGPRGAGKRGTAEALAGEMGVRLLVVSLGRLPLGDHSLSDFLALIFREAWLQGALLYLDDLDALHGEQGTVCRRALAGQLAQHPGVTILAGAQIWVPLGEEPLGVLVVPFVMPDFARRRQIWEETLAGYGVSLAPADLDALAGRFRVAPGQIRDVALTACNGARWRMAANSPEPSHNLLLPAPTLGELFAAARSQTGHDLMELARKIEPVYGWEDIVLPGDPLAQLHELCQRVAHRQRVMGEWGFDRKLSQGKGISALFAGPPGTGKTMATEVIARELGLDLFKIDLSAVISKYIGETEKNLERIFAAATDANAILLFDEADALFGKRSEVRDSHDRYANIEIAYLLQRMEQYDGLAILATNLRQHLDDAFTRRLQFVVEFPFPDEADRCRIWQVCFPTDAPRDPEIDFEQLARKFRLPGGNINNIVLGAAFFAAAENIRIGMGHLLQATRREYQKMGKV